MTLKGMPVIPRKKLSRRLWVGVDIGGSKVAVLVVDTQKRVRGRATAPTDVSGPERTVASIVAAIQEGLRAANAQMEEIAAVGLGIPGRVLPETGVVQLAVNLNLKESPVGELLEAQLGAPCFLENDVRVATSGVYHFNGNHTLRNMAYLSVGTGIAAGLIINGELYRGSSGMAGEIGHMVIDPQGPRCGCGAFGCLETFSAGPAIARLGRRAAELGTSRLLKDQELITAETVYEAARQGDPAAQAIVEKAGRYLGQALQWLVTAYDVERIVLGGGVSSAGETFWQPIERELDRQRKTSPLASDLLAPDMFHLLPPDYDAAIWGAIALAQQGLEKEQEKAASWESV
jgi:glucokinase